MFVSFYWASIGQPNLVRFGNAAGTSFIFTANGCDLAPACGNPLDRYITFDFRNAGGASSIRFWAGNEYQDFNVFEFDLWRTRARDMGADAARLSAVSGRRGSIARLALVLSSSCGLDRRFNGTPREATVASATSNRGRRRFGRLFLIEHRIAKRDERLAGRFAWRRSPQGPQRGCGRHDRYRVRACEPGHSPDRRRTADHRLASPRPARSGAETGAAARARRWLRRSGFWRRAIRLARARAIA